MKKWLLCCCLLLALPLAAQAVDEKIDPANYICAEFVAQGAVSQDPPVFQYRNSRSSPLEMDKITYCGVLPVEFHRILII